jgi:hypothetical protein
MTTSEANTISVTQTDFNNNYIFFNQSTGHFHRVLAGRKNASTTMLITLSAMQIMKATLFPPCDIVNVTRRVGTHR